MAGPWETQLVLVQILAGSWEIRFVLAQILAGPLNHGKPSWYWLKSWLVPRNLSWYWLRYWLILRPWESGLVLAHILAGPLQTGLVFFSCLGWIMYNWTSVGSGFGWHMKVERGWYMAISGLQLAQILTGPSATELLLGTF